MNNKRRDNLRQAAELLSRASTIVDNVALQEGDAMDNIPENLQGSDRYADMENAVDTLEDVVEEIDSAKDKIEAVINA